MHLPGLITEGGVSLVLLAIVAAFVLGWKPKLTAKKVSVVGSLLLIVNLCFLFITQEKSLDVYGPTFWFFAIPILFLVDSGPRKIASANLIFITFFMLGFLELKLVQNNYISYLSAAIILILAFQLWRDPREEGFIRTKGSHWNIALGTLCIFVMLLAFSNLLGWEKALATRYLKESRWMLAVSAALFFFVKAIPEELIFRGIFQGALKDKIGFRSALISSAALYGLTALNNPAPWAFPNWHAAINATLLGLGCGIVYHKTKSLAVSAVLNTSVSCMWWALLARGGN
ncbi:MAG: hypothetical protein G01um101419_542 [Parcubacteria group bacterium Gr01-1014_19]|nr:MAG: hypothetical protein G01um101419_542 [Parcubacteria group bacterium Gr01-1014_19]